MTLTSRSFNPRFWLAFGLTVWFVATVALRFFGQWIFLPDSVLAVTILFAASIPVMFALMQMAYSMTKVQPTEKLLGAVYVIVPGLLLDGLLYAAPTVLMPNLSVAQAGLVAAWLLWCYGWVLVTALFNPSKLSWSSL
jgi:hypothetical protein